MYGTSAMSYDNVILYFASRCNFLRDCEHYSSTGRSSRKLQTSESIPKTTTTTSNNPLYDKIWISDDACTCFRYLSNVQR